jgi:hypothetical protein
MQISRLGRSLRLAAVLCVAPVVAFVPGCGGGSGSGLSIPSAVAPNSTLVGSYSGRFNFISGPNSGNSGALTLVAQ